MAGKFLRPGAIVDLIRSEQRTNAIQKRLGLTHHPVTVTSCGCPDPDCGGWHTIRAERLLPTKQECAGYAPNSQSIKRRRRKRLRVLRPSWRVQEPAATR